MPPRLTYLDLKGIAEPIRLAFWISGVEFEDVRVSYDEVKALRAAKAMPFGQVPVLEFDGETYSQSAAILRHVGRMTKMLPEPNDAHALMRVEMLLEGVRDVMSLFNAIWYENVLPRAPDGERPIETMLTPEQLAATQRLLNDVYLPYRLDQIETMMSVDCGPFVNGADASVADVSLYALMDGLYDGSYAKGVRKISRDAYPCIRRMVEAIEAFPQVREANARNAARYDAK
jgi:prostaglandin-H2 D-isomerase / glutathione transferase